MSNIRIEESNFLIKKENLSKALELLKDYTDETDFENAMSELDINIGFDNDGNVSSINFGWDCPEDSDDILEALAPVVENGSYIWFVSEEGEHWRVNFINGKKISERAIHCFASVPLFVLICHGNTEDPRACGIYHCHEGALYAASKMIEKEQRSNPHRRGWVVEESIDKLYFFNPQAPGDCLIFRVSETTFYKSELD